MMAPQVLQNLLDEIAKELNYGKPDVNIKSVTTGGANYSSALYTATISEPDKEDLHLFAKVAIMGETAREQIPFDVFDIESTIYVDLLSKYEQLQDKHDVPLEKRLVIPKYYGSNPKKFEETIVLENLMTKGFTTYDRFKSIDWNYASKSVEAMARLHALSIAYKEEYPEEYNQFVDKMKPMGDTIINLLNGFYKQRIQSTLDVTTEKNKNKLKKYLEIELNSDAIIDQFEKSKKQVLCHGDYRPSNLMHRVNENGVLELVPVDYQTIRSSSPLTDLLYLIFTGTDEAFRRQYFQQLIDLYYDEFSSALRRFKIKSRHRLYEKGL